MITITRFDRVADERAWSVTGMVRAHVDHPTCQQISRRDRVACEHVKHPPCATYRIRHGETLAAVLVSPSSHVIQCT